MDENRTRDEIEREADVTPAQAGGEQQTSDVRPAAEPATQPPALPAEDDEPMPPIAKLGRYVARFDRALSDDIPDAISGASQRSAESARKAVMSGRWHNYAFLVVLALVALTVAVLLARGCLAGGGA